MLKQTMTNILYKLKNDAILDSVGTAVNGLPICSGKELHQLCIWLKPPMKET